MLFEKKPLVTALTLVMTTIFAGCSSDDGSNGSDGLDGVSGMDGFNSLILQTEVPAGNAQCFYGGTRIDSGADMNNNSLLDGSEITDTSYVCENSSESNFVRIASFPVCEQLAINCDTDDETAAEIVVPSQDGLTLIYTDSPKNTLGFVDISNPADPQAGGTMDLGGEPTSVAVKDGYALVAINTSTDFINVAGELLVININDRSIEASITLGGQPDSIAISPDGNYAAIAIENERDEDLGDGAPTQLPAGQLDIIDLVGMPAAWTVRAVDLIGITDLYPSDPEPEYVDINTDNIAVVTLQENNHIILVDVTDGSIVNDFSAGSVDLTAIDKSEESPALISLTESESAVLREPDGVSWINNSLFATADEGDLDGGSRGFTLFNIDGDVVYNSANELDHYAVAFGQYPDARSKNKGNEPENVDFGSYGEKDYLFVASERSSLVFVYDMNDPANPLFKQVLPAGSAPEGVKVIPSRNLLVAASEADDREAKIRSVVNIYQYQQQAPSFPTLVSVDRADGTPIPWSALSGLAADPEDANIAYSIEDSFYQQSRIFTLDLGSKPAKVVVETHIKDSNDVLASIAAVALNNNSVDDDDASRIGVFDEADLAALINVDKTVNLDPEGIAVASDGGFWIASEGAGTVGDAGRPINSRNMLLKTDAAGVIENVIELPAELNDVQLRFGFEGVSEYDGNVYVVFQRAWDSESDPRIGIYNISSQSWSFVYYPLDVPASQNGGWVGLSDLTSLGDGRFMVVERDNQGGPDAAIKRLYTIDLNGVAADSTVSKILLRDLLDDLKAGGGLVFEKIEGAALLANGEVIIVNDNDGVDDNSGETQLINLGSILN
jgi:hypothetical protein